LSGIGLCHAGRAVDLSMLVRAFKFELVKDRPAVPIAHLTLRSKDGIWLKLTPRNEAEFSD